MNRKNNSVKIIVLSVLFLFLTAIFAGCVSENDDGNDKPKDHEQIISDLGNEASYKMINENQGNQNFLIIDVRTPEEFADGHIENAINIDFYSDTFSEELNKLDKNKTYLIYCRSANRSGQALDIMSDLDFSEVYNMLGGIIEWKDNGYPIVY